jgi:tetratricopeptide (TPR) repeat protein
VEESKKVIELDHDYPYAHLVLGRAYILQGNYDKGLVVLDKAKLLTFREGHLGYGHAISGNKKEAHELLDGLNDNSRPKHIIAYQIALIYCGLGERDYAFDWLEKAYEQHGPQLVWLKVTPEFEPLHSDPRWDNLLIRMGLGI